MARLRKGQVFIIGALLFSSIMLMAFFASGTAIKGQSESTFRNYYVQAFEETGNVFNDALRERLSPDPLKQALYRYDRFVELQSGKKDIEYSSINFFVLPENGEAVFINYRGQNTTAEIRINGNIHNIEVAPKQWRKFSFTPGTTSIRIIIDNPSIDADFDASSPRLFNYAEMSRENEIWSNYRIH